MNPSHLTGKAGLANEASILLKRKCRYKLYVRPSQVHSSTDIYISVVKSVSSVSSDAFKTRLRLFARQVNAYHDSGLNYLVIWRLNILISSQECLGSGGKLRDAFSSVSDFQSETAL